MMRDEMGEKKVGADLFCGVLIPLRERLKELQRVCM